METQKIQIAKTFVRKNRDEESCASIISLRLYYKAPAIKYSLVLA